MGFPAIRCRSIIVHYREPYRSYKEICWLSLEESFQHFGIPGGTGDLIERYFAIFPEMQLYPDVLPTSTKTCRVCAAARGWPGQARSTIE